MMKNPVHPGKLVEANIKELGLSVAEAAKAMKVTRQQLYNVMREKSAVSPDMALRFEKAFGGGAAMWLAMQSAYDLAQARRAQRNITIRRLTEHRIRFLPG
ncbi:MAG: addiction module antidote protein, HigA family [Nitrospira sp.]|nr:MAG: addiction module antidote protein, HigA family [Nitrospira sp.]